MNISIVGVGYLGLTTASVLANAGFKVYAVDINSEVIEKLKRGEAHFYELGLSELVRSAIESGNLIPTLNYKEAIPNSDVSFVCVDTVGLEDGSLSTKSVESAVKNIAENMNDNHVLVIKSTVPAGTHLKVKEIVRSITNQNFNYVSKPEFLTEGSAVLDTLLPERLVIGTSSDMAYEMLFDIFKKVDEFSNSLDISNYTKYANIYSKRTESIKKFEERVIRVGVESAGLIKVTSNSFLALKISFANMLARVSDKVGADINEIMKGVGADPRIGRDFLYAGLGWGGGCFPKDVKGLIKSGEDSGCDMSLLEDTYKINEDQTIWVISKARKILGESFSNSHITILGLAFKPGTDDLRLSPATELLSEISANVANISVYDPQAMQKAKSHFEYLRNIEFSTSIYNAVENSDLVILATDWPEFVNPDYAKWANLMRIPNFLDARNKWDKSEIEKVGGNYFGLGR